MPRRRIVLLQYKKNAARAVYSCFGSTGSGTTTKKNGFSPVNFVRSSKELCVCWVDTFKASTDKTSWAKRLKGRPGDQRLAMT